MDLKLNDKVIQFNRSQKYTQKAKERAVIKDRIEAVIDSIGNGIKNAISTIPEIPDKIQKYRDYKKLQELEDQYILDMYRYFLEVANLCENKTGIDVDPQNEIIKIIYTDFGPLFIAKLDDFTALEIPVSRQAVEGFLPDDDGLLKYFNIEIQTPKKSNKSILIGHLVNPETMKASPVDRTISANKSKILFYIKKQEDLARKQSQENQSPQTTSK